MKVYLITHTPDPERVVAAAAKLCYSSCGIENLFENLTDEKVHKFLDNLSSMGHESPMEHISFTFGIEDVSRSLLAQITRHRIASFSVQSQRYVNMNNFSPVVPDDIYKVEEAFGEFSKTVEIINKSYNSLVNILVDKYVEDGMDKKTAEKKAQENARSVLPNACPTKMIITMNARSLKNFFSLRCCNRAQDEIRELAWKMFELIYNVAPHIFSNSGPDCITSKCGEGKMSCGKYIDVKNKYDSIVKGK